MAEARDLLPGGVNSPVRAFKSVGGNPIVFERVKGPYCWDVDGNKCVAGVEGAAWPHAPAWACMAAHRVHHACMHACLHARPTWLQQTQTNHPRPVTNRRYVDYIGSWGPAIVGAANDEVNEVLKAQIEKGTSFGAPGPLEVC